MRFAPRYTAGRPRRWPWSLSVGAAWSIPRRWCGSYWQARHNALRDLARHHGLRVSVRKVGGRGITVRIVDRLAPAAVGGSQSVPGRAGKAAQSLGHHGCGGAL